MLRSVVRVVTGLVVALLASGTRVRGETVFELQAGSTITDDCLDCDRIPLTFSLEGTFVVSQGVSGGFGLDSLQLQSPEEEFVIGGQGNYTVRDPASAELSLDVEVNGVAGVHLESGPVEDVGWPFLDATTTESGERDPLHVYTLRLRAAPRVDMRPYKLQVGSIFIDDCLPCGRPTVPLPITGRFLLGEVDGGANPVVSYRVDEVDFTTTPEVADYRIRGSGRYRQGGEVAVLQEVELLLEVTGPFGVDREVQMASGALSIPRKLPEIEVGADHVNPPTVFRVFSLQIVAGPVDSPPAEFRRGDDNADGIVDISDPVFSLEHQFLGLGDPGCLAALDTNADTVLDITDPIYNLEHQFLGQPAPPLPYPGCGPESLPAQEALPCKTPQESCR